MVLYFYSCQKSKNINNHRDVDNEFVRLHLLASNQNLSYSVRKINNIKAEKILGFERNDSLYRVNLSLVAYNYARLFDFERFKITTNRLFSKSIKSNDFIQQAKAYDFFAIYYQEKSINDSAFYYYLKAEKLYQKLKDNTNLSKALYGKGLVKYYENDFIGSETELIKSLKIAKDKNNYEYMYKAYALLAINSFERNEYERAIKYNNIALLICEKHKINIVETTNPLILNNIGGVLIKVNMLDSALFFLKRGVSERNIVRKDPQTYTYLQDNLGYCAFKQKNYLNALSLYLSSAKIRDSLNIDHGRNINKLYLSEYYAAMKDTVKAINYAHESFNLSKSYRAPGDMLLALKQLAVVEPKNALKYAESYINISDSMHQLERETRNKFAKIAYETEEITNEKDTAVKQSGIFLSIAVLVFTFGVLLFIIFYQRNKQKKLQFDRQQQKANEEIYQLIQIQHEKIEEGRLIEKKRIARDLHDGIMNKLASTRFNLHLLTKKNDPNAFIKCTPYINDIHEIEKEIRNIAHDLNNDIFSENDSFKNTLFSFFEEQKQIIGGKWHIEISKEINWEIFKTNKKIHIFRIFQELLHNISKHAAAKNIIISSSIKDSHLFLEVYDDGKGFSLNAKKKGIGLQNIKIRVRACDGTLKILSDKGIGTKVIIKIPTQTENKTV